MSRRIRVILVGAAGLGLAVVGGAAYRTLYASPRAALEARAAQIRADVDARERATDELPGLRKRLAAAAATTLGTDEETVSAALRTALNEILAHGRMADPSVSTRRPEAVRNPAAARVSEITDRAARNRPDLFAVEATARATGSLEAALRTLATLQAQPWAHRIDRWTIAPVDRSRERFELTVELTSAYLAERFGPTLADAPKAWKAIDEEAQSQVRPILARAAFKAPPPAPAAAVVAESRPPAPPYEDWRITSLSRGRTGWEMWLRNTRSGQTLTVMAGERVMDARFIDATVEAATLEIGGARYVVALGQALSDRRPVSQ
jgi:hypothetical protein